MITIILDFIFFRQLALILISIKFYIQVIVIWVRKTLNKVFTTKLYFRPQNPQLNKIETPSKLSYNIWLHFLWYILKEYNSFSRMFAIATVVGSMQAWVQFPLGLKLIKKNKVFSFMFRDSLTEYLAKVPVDRIAL